jgi:hypothetical protein
MTSAVLSKAATCGAGSKVWLFVPSGTMPLICTRLPPMLAAIEVMGATEVATLSRSLAPVVAPQALISSMVRTPTITPTPRATTPRYCEWVATAKHMQ